MNIMTITEKSCFDDFHGYHNYHDYCGYGGYNDNHIRATIYSLYKSIMNTLLFDYRTIQGSKRFSWY